MGKWCRRVFHFFFFFFLNVMKYCYLFRDTLGLMLNNITHTYYNFFLQSLCPNRHTYLLSYSLIPLILIDTWLGSWDANSSIPFFGRFHPFVVFLHLRSICRDHNVKWKTHWPNHLFPPPVFFLITHSRHLIEPVFGAFLFLFLTAKLCFCFKLCCFSFLGPLEKGHRIVGNYREKRRHLSVLVVWDFKWSCWQFPLTVGHCGAGRFCFGAPTPGSKAQSAAICWTSAVPAANVLNNATSTMNSVPWQKEGAQSGAGVQKYTVPQKRLCIKP